MDISGALVQLVGLFLVAVITVVSNHLRLYLQSLKDKSEYDNVLDTLSEAVSKVEADFVSEIKEASADGKLTDQEKKQAMNMAVDIALRLAKGKEKDMLLNFTKEKVEAMIEKVLLDAKNR